MSALISKRSAGTDYVYFHRLLLITCYTVCVCVCVCVYAYVFVVTKCHFIRTESKCGTPYYRYK